MDGERGVLRDQTVLVQGERIVGLGPRGSTSVPRGATRIDATGRYLIPGLADMHVHLEYIEDPAILELFVTHGVTTVRNMDGRPWILEWKRRVASGELTGPRILTAGPLLDGDPPILPDNRVVRSAAEGRDAVLQANADGYDFVKVYTNLSPEAYGGILEAAREAGMVVTGHAPRAVSLDTFLLGGQATIEHVTALGRWIEADDSPFAGRWHWTKLHMAVPVSESRLADVADRIARSGITVVPTLVQSNRALAPEPALDQWMKDEVMAVISEGGRELWLGSMERATQRMDADDWVFVETGARNRAMAVSVLASRGVPLLVGTDTPSPFVVPGASVHEELGNFVSAGLTPYEALAAATREAARFLGEEGEWGRIAPGLRADLLLLEASPLDDIANTRRIAGTMLKGQWMPREELDRRRRAVSIP